MNVDVNAPVRESGGSTSAVIRASAIDPLELERQLVKVPYDFLKRSFRSGSRVIEREMSEVVGAVGAVSDSKEPLERAVARLNTCVDRLRGLKRKLSEISQSEEKELKRSRVRLDYLNCLKDGDQNERETQQRTKLDRILIDYMLRSSYLKTASKLINSSPIQEDLADLRVFEEAQQIVEALKNRDCSKALAWCAENKFRLKKAESAFEFKLRIQEFLELVRAGQAMEAIDYSRQHLGPSGRKYMKEFLQAMCTLAFPRPTQCSVYKALFSDSQWENLIQMFKQEFYKLHEMPTESLLHIHFQAGLAVLKTPTCYEGTSSREDPLTHEAIRKLAAPLPFAKKEKSTLVCFITREQMNEHNPPRVLPNGFAYSSKALEAMAKENNGMVTCPRTGQSFSLNETIRAFVS